MIVPLCSLGDFTSVHRLTTSDASAALIQGPATIALSPVAQPKELESQLHFLTKKYDIT